MNRKIFMAAAMLAFIVVAYLSYVFLNSGDQSSAVPNKITLATTAPPKTLNMLVAQETSSTSIAGLIMGEGMTTRNPVSGEIEPGLAKSWDVEKKENGGVEIIFRLRRSLKWNDGAPFTADDVMFTYEDLIWNDDVNADIRALLSIDGEPIKLEKMDRYTVKAILPRPFRPALSSLGFTIMPKHKLASKVHKLNPEVEPGTFNNTWGPDTEPEEIVGMGPYKLGSMVQGSKITLVRNPHYWKVDKKNRRLPYIDRIEFLVVEDLNAMQLKFEQGEIDALAPRPESWSGIKDMAEEKGWKTVEDGPTFGTNFLVINQSYGMAKDKMDETTRLKRELFQNVKFRKALAHAMDKDSMIRSIYHNLAIKQWSPISIPSPFYDDSESFETYEYDLDEAKAILDGIGLEDVDGDGIRELSNGEDLVLNLTTNAGNNQREDICNLLLKDFQEIGIKVEYRPMEFNSLVGRLTGGRYEAVVIGLTGGIEPHSGSNVYKTDGGLHMWHWEAKEEPFDWEKEVEKAFLAGAYTMDIEEAKKAYAKFQRLFTEWLPLIYTVNQQYIYAIDDSFHNTQDFGPLGSVLSFIDVMWKDGADMDLERVDSSAFDVKMLDEADGLELMPQS